ncbi:MAG TPA: hypothetical protein VNU01_06600, partial [Egibacteraceae bacterium]|nr:hypothetical protein [Egibacteraceae bacterium]
MRLEVTEEQHHLRQSLHACVSKRNGAGWPAGSPAAGGDIPHDAGLYRELMSLGLADVTDERDRGVLFEEAGRWILPAPVLNVAGLAVPVLRHLAPDAGVLDQ